MTLTEQQDSYLDAKVGDLAKYVTPVKANDNCIEVYETARKNRFQRYIPVTSDEGIPLGLIDRLQALEELGHRYFRELNRKNPIALFVHNHQMIESNQRIDDLAHQISREDNTLYDAFMVVEEGTYCGIVSFQDLLREIFERKQSHLFHLAHYDKLTGLPNRMLFLDRLGLACEFAQRQKRTVGLLFIDLDGFKYINDNLGHDAGDFVLQEVARRIPPLLRKVDTLARLGGDEFTVVLSDLKERDKVIKIAERIIKAISSPIQYQNHDSLRVTGSIGVSIYPEHGLEIETLVKCADMAMYEAKNQGKNNYQLFTPQMREHMEERLHIEQSLHRAIEYNEFHLHYQPIVNLTTGRIEMAEALLRWTRRNGEKIYPDRFLHLAEESRFILHITDWLLEETAKQQQAWDAQGLVGLKLCVNLSPLDFQDPSLMSRVRHAIEQHDLNPSRMVLEMTETVFSLKLDHTFNIMKELAQLGFCIALDDFGSGFSSLALMHELPIHIVKIDRSFVHNLNISKESRKLVKAIISMAKTLDFKVISEGVEELDELEFLERAGSDYYQGYYCSRAKNPAEFELFLQHWPVTTSSSA